MKTSALLCSVYFTVFLSASGCVHSRTSPARTVEKTASTVLVPLEGKSKVALLSQMGERGLVIIAHSADCPISRKYSPVVENLRREFSEKGFTFLYLNTTEITDAAKVRNYLKEYSVETPVFFDPEFTLARQLGMERTSEAVLLSPQWTVLYQGAIDDRLDYEISRPVQVSFLRNALQQWLSSGQVTQASHPAKGCALGY